MNQAGTNRGSTLSEADTTIGFFGFDCRGAVVTLGEGRFSLFGAPDGGSSRPSQAAVLTRSSGFVFVSFLVFMCLDAERVWRLFEVASRWVLIHLGRVRIYDFPRLRWCVFRRKITPGNPTMYGFLKRGVHPLSHGRRTPQNPLRSLCVFILAHSPKITLRVAPATQDLSRRDGDVGPHFLRPVRDPEGSICLAEIPAERRQIHSSDLPDCSSIPYVEEGLVMIRGPPVSAHIRTANPKDQGGSMNKRRPGPERPGQQTEPREIGRSYATPEPETLDNGPIHVHHSKLTECVELTEPDSLDKFQPSGPVLYDSGWFDSGGRGPAVRVVFVAGPPNEALRAWARELILRPTSCPESEQQA